MPIETTLSTAPMSESPESANQSKNTTTPPVDTLSELEHSSWEQLLAGIEHPESPFKTMTIATCTHRGADARMVVLRGVDKARKYVWFYTDARAEKVMQLEARPMATLLFWDNERQIQLRLSIETRLHTDDYIADEHWQKVAVSSRKAYLSALVPGSEQPNPYPGFPEQLADKLPSAEESETGRKNFAVIECRVLAMEYLHLSRSGQTRACFQYEPESRMVWLAP